MMLSYAIARRLRMYKSKTFTAFIIKVAIVAVALSTTVMILGTAITRGYQQLISKKFYEAWGQIHITHLLPDPGSFLNEEKMMIDSNLIQHIYNNIPQVASIHSYGMQTCLLKTNNDLEGVFIKAVDNDKSNLLQKEYIIKGNAIQFENDTTNIFQLVVSQNIAQKLSIDTGMNLLIYFVSPEENIPKARKAIIKGIYKTGLEDYDNHIVICNLAQLNKINNEAQGTIKGYELYLNENVSSIDIKNTLENEYIELPVKAYRIEERFDNIFSWLSLMKMNERVIIIIMFVIAVINMMTAILVLILERTRMIGILKAMGMQNISIEKIFLWSSIYIMLKGILIGLVLALLLCYAQYTWGIVKLDEAIYYVNQVPIYIDIYVVLTIVFGSIFMCALLLVIPVWVVKYISPIKAIRFQ